MERLDRAFEAAITFKPISKKVEQEGGLEKGVSNFGAVIVEPHRNFVSALRILTGCPLLQDFC